MIASRASGPRAYRSSSDTCSYLDNHPNIEENTNSPITMSGERRTHPSMLVSMCLAGGVAHGVDRSLFFGFFTHFSYISLKSCNSVDRFPSDHPSIFFPVFLRFSVSLQEPWKLVETHRRS
jgi:hypothetical protein